MDLEVLLVRAAGSTLEAVCGKPDDGPIVLQLSYRMQDGSPSAQSAMGAFCLVRVPPAGIERHLAATSSRRSVC